MCLLLFIFGAKKLSQSSDELKSVHLSGLDQLRHVGLPVRLRQQDFAVAGQESAPEAESSVGHDRVVGLAQQRQVNG